MTVRRISPPLVQDSARGGMPLKRRLIHGVLALAAIAAGLLVHLRGEALGPVARDVAGDALWGAMIAWCAGVLSPTSSIARRAALAYLICSAVEVSQLYHSPRLDAVRSTRLGHLVLGSGFDLRDLAAYAIGVGVAAIAEAVSVSRAARHPTAT
ncbi:MAG: DUF2809 domain-containing protein [Isosphaeraceae bacterium]